MAENANANDNNTPSVDDLLAELAAERAQRAKDKAALDKALKQNGELTKSLRSRQTAEEAAEEQRNNATRELQEKYDALLRENTLNKYEKKYLEQGYTAEQARKASIALADGDTDSLFAIQKNAFDANLKAKMTDWLNDRPQANSGVNGSGSISKEQFNNMGLIEKSELKRKNPAEYERLRNL